jgi:hypothetical protein
VTKIKCRCLDCNGIFNGNPKNLIKQRGCPPCGARKAKETIKYNINTDDFRHKLQKIKPTITVLGEYINSWSKILVKCDICTNEWQSTPTNLVDKNFYGCVRCGHSTRVQKSFLLSQDQYETKVKDLFGDKIKIIGEYTGGKNDIDFLCNKCEKIYSKKAQLLTNGRGCLICQKSKSKFEDIIEQKLINSGLNFKQQFSFTDLKSKKYRPLFFDFCILDNDNIPQFIIEYHGEQHYTPIKYFGGEKRFEDQQEVDRKKEQYLIDNKIEYAILNKSNWKKFDWNNLYERCKASTDLAE